MAHPGGRPTKYKKEYCQEIIRFFDRPRIETKKQTLITKSGVQMVEREKAAQWPTLIDFAHKIGIDMSTLWRWAEEHEEFRKSVNKAKELQESFLIHNGLDGFYQPQIFALVATNFTSMKNKESKEISGPDGGDIKTNITVKFIRAGEDKC